MRSEKDTCTFTRFVGRCCVCVLSTQRKREKAKLYKPWRDQQCLLYSCDLCLCSSWAESGRPFFSCTWNTSNTVRMYTHTHTQTNTEKRRRREKPQWKKRKWDENRRVRSFVRSWKGCARGGGEEKKMTSFYNEEGGRGKKDEEWACLICFFHHRRRKRRKRPRPTNRPMDQVSEDSLLLYSTTPCLKNLFSKGRKREDL